MIDRMETVAKACKNMEPIETVTMDEIIARGIEITALTSIAVSLKRIADKLELAQKQPIMMTSVEYAKYEQSKNREVNKNV